MTGNVVLSEVHALTRMYVVLNEPEELVPYGELVDITEYITL